MKEKRDTVGRLARMAFEKYAGEYDIEDIREEAQKDYLNKLVDTAYQGTKSYNDDFFVVVESKIEPLMKNVIRNYIFHRSTCPTPHYGQTVYRYRYTTDELEYLWCVPDKNQAEHIREHVFEYPESYRGLVEHVIDFYDGTLARKALELNKEDMRIAEHVVIH